jgi:hypothetical protein
VGLLFDLVGVGVLFFWPPPAEIMSRSGKGFLAFPPTEERKREQGRQWSKQLRNARAGILLVGVGFLLQLLGQLISV